MGIQWIVDEIDKNIKEDVFQTQQSRAFYSLAKAYIELKKEVDLINEVRDKTINPINKHP